MKIGIVGGSGWIGSSLGRALIETGRCAAPDLVILNRQGSVGSFYDHAVTWATSVSDLVAQADVVVVSVRPQDWRALALDAQGKLVISVMAGVPLRVLPQRCLRALPNAAAELRQSYTPWFAGAGVNAQDNRDSVAILSAIGQCAAVESEFQLDLMTATVGAGPAYAALMARAMLAFLLENGVSRSIAEQATEGMICGAAPLLAGKIGQASEMVQRFIEYQGTTAAGLNTAVARGVEDGLKAAFAAATAKAKAMSDGF